MPKYSTNIERVGVMNILCLYGTRLRLSCSQVVSVFSAYTVQCMTDLAEQVGLHCFHQRCEYVSELADITS